MFKKSRQGAKPLYFNRPPEFTVIDNIYSELDKLIETYGATKVILHLGKVVDKRLTRDFASKVWALVATPADPNQVATPEDE